MAWSRQHPLAPPPCTDPLHTAGRPSHGAAFPFTDPGRQGTLHGAGCLSRTEPARRKWFPFGTWLWSEGPHRAETRGKKRAGEAEEEGG